jgi:hypothetical protein
MLDRHVLSLRDSVRSGAVSFFQPTSSLSRALRGINRAFYAFAELLSPLRSIEGSETVTIENPKGDTGPRYFEMSIPGARSFMVPIANPPVELLEEITGFWSAIVDDDLVRIYYVPKASMGEITADFRVRVLK